MWPKPTGVLLDYINHMDNVKKLTESITRYIKDINAMTKKRIIRREVHTCLYWLQSFLDEVNKALHNSRPQDIRKIRYIRS